MFNTPETTTNVATLTIFDKAQAFMVNRIAQASGDAALFAATTALLQKLPASDKEFTPYSFSEGEAVVLRTGLTLMARGIDGDYYRQAAVMMLDENDNPNARPINDLPQEMREEEMAALGLGSWMERMKTDPAVRNHYVPPYHPDHTA